MAAPRPRRSLKARALQWLAQREHSRLELERKLLRAARARHADAVGRAGGPAPHRDAPGGVRGDVHGDAHADAHDDAPFDLDASRAEIAALLDELERDGWLAAERFVESRVHARAARYGNRRIQQELAQHAVALPDEAARALAASEPARAQAVRARRFAQPPVTPEERARQARFLAARGFSPEVIHRVLRDAARGDGTGA